MIRWKGFAYNPIIFEDNGWHFYDETWASTYGPYHSHIEASSNLLDYCEYLNQERGSDESICNG